MPGFNHSKGYLQDKEMRHPCRALAGGNAKLRELAGAGVYMWPKPRELNLAYKNARGSNLAVDASATVYDIRVKGSVVRNVWLQTLMESAEAPLRHEIQFDGWSNDIDEFRNNVDGCGVDIQKYMNMVLREQHIDGMHYTLVELPDMADDEGNVIIRTKQEDIDLGIRPYWVPIFADHFDPLEFSFIGGQWKLSNCAIYRKIRDRSFVEDRPYESKDSIKSVWREYKLFTEGKRVHLKRWDHVLKKSDDLESDIDIEKSGPWIDVKGDGGDLDEIPIVPFYGNFDTFKYRATPPYLESAEIQLGCWRRKSSKDQHAEEAARVRTFMSGLKLDKDQTVANQLDMDFLYSTNIDARASILETTGAALESIRDDLRDDEEFIKEYNKSLFASRSTGVITATEIGLVGLRSSSRQESLVICNSASLSKALELTDKIMNSSPGNVGTVSWRKDAFSSITSETLERLKDLVKEGLFSIETYLSLEKRNGGLPEDFEVEGEIDRIISERRKRFGDEVQ